MASKIDRDHAQSLINEFRTQNKAAGEHAWKTYEGQHLNGFFINRECLENLLKDKENAGIHVYLAKHPDFTGKPDKVHTLAVVGAKPSPAGATAPYTNDGDVYEMIPPCPPWCGTM
ncbi:MAG: hypothetical protein JSU01_15640 [Bacteroidetes bacterium]|nr:hypothetical protein [Bacteroidota bacterium]